MNQQPTRSKTYREPREFDKTSLKTTDTFRVSRDILAHAFRYGFVRKFLDHSTRVLDAGCGVDLPLIKTLAGGYANTIPKRYVGCDLNSLPACRLPWATLHEKFNFVADYEKLGSDFDVVVSLEVLEHTDEENGRKFLKGLKHCLASDGTLILSTPNFNGIAARNHIKEWRAEELEEAFAQTGLQVSKRYGTFASYHAIKKVLSPEVLALLNKINEFYHGDVSSCFLAPAFPAQSRNICWILKHA